MYVQDNKEKIGKVTIEHNFQGKYTRLRFTYPKGKRQVITIGLTNATNRNAAKGVANTINADIAGDKIQGLYECFDETLAKYDPNRQSVALEVVKEEKEPTIKELWEQYKKRNKNIAAKTTQKDYWKVIDKFLSDLPEKALLLKNLQILGDESLKIRALSSCHRFFQSLQPALRSYEKLSNINLKKQLPSLPKKRVKWFESNEVQGILEAFKSNRFNSDFSAYKHSYYYPYVAFCAYTGCRPEEAIALTWGDLHWNPDKTQCQVTINKVYVNKILKYETKNGLVRVIPLSSRMIEILKTQNKPKKKTDLIFSGVKGGYLNIRSYRKNIWKPIIDSLVKIGIVHEYLKPYCLRHSFVTNLHYNHHVSFSVIAGLIGDDIKTVIDYYTGLKPFDAGKMPDIY